MIKVCAQCGRTFDARTKKVKLCSSECVHDYLTGMKKRPKKNQKSKQVIYKQCEYCGGIFSVNGCKHQQDKRFCSPACASRSRRIRTNIKCEYCGKEFYPKEKETRYCSLSCSSKAQAPEKKIKLMKANAEVWEAFRREKERKKKEKQQEHETRKREAYINRLKNAEQAEMNICTCEWCGEPFIALRGIKKYCSEKCRARAQYKRGEIARRMRIKKNNIDNVSLEELYKRDGGICHICGKQCRYEDYTVVNEIFIAGNYYPSIDHIIPLAKGGEHSYENVKLAHRICNTKRGAKMLTQS